MNLLLASEVIVVVVIVFEQSSFVAFIDAVRVDKHAEDNDSKVNGTEDRECWK